MSLRVFKIPIQRQLNPSELGWISNTRASSEDGLNVNHEYVDLRGKTLQELSSAIDWEQRGWTLMAANDYRYPILSEYLEAQEEADEEWNFGEVEFGMVSICYALSVLGCVPITSCRGPSFEDGFPHQQDVPCVSFYIRRSLISLLMSIAEQARIGLANDEEGMAELYSDDLRKILTAAELIRDHLTLSITGKT